MSDAYTTKSRKIMTARASGPLRVPTAPSRMLPSRHLAADNGNLASERLPSLYPPGSPIHDDPGCITCPLSCHPHQQRSDAQRQGRGRWHYGGRIAVPCGVWEGILIQHATHDVGPTMTAPIPALIFHRFYSRPFPSPRVRPTRASPFPLPPRQSLLCHSVPHSLSLSPCRGRFPRYPLAPKLP